MKANVCKGENCEIIQKKFWAGKSADMLFSLVYRHNDCRYTKENPYLCMVDVDMGSGGKGREVKVSFDATVCEYDNFKSVVIRTKDKNFKVEFNEDGELYFNNINTQYPYDIGKWYHFEIYFTNGIFLEINGKPSAKIKEQHAEIQSIALETRGLPTYGPILPSCIGICNIQYEYTNRDFESVSISRPDYMPHMENCDIDAVAATVNSQLLAPMDNGGREIRHSLNFFESDCQDVKIRFYSNNESVVTRSGRVIRPKAGEGNVPVLITAVISDSSRKIEKTFSYTVMEEEKFHDPLHMSDEEFFGKYENGEWKVEGKIDYSMLPSVEDSIKTGNFRQAKEELLDYFRRKEFDKEIDNEEQCFRRKKYKAVSNIEQEIYGYEADKGYTEMILNDFHQLSQGYFLSAFYVGEKKVKMNTELIKTNATITFSIRAMHNESSSFVLEGKPILTVYTEKRNISYEAEDIAMICAGDYRDENFFGEPIKTCMYGEFLGNKTSYILLKFSVFGIEKTENILSAFLEISGRIEPEYVKEKRLIVIKEFSSMWDSRSVKFSDLLYGVFSYEGLTVSDVNKWSRPPQADVEYLWQAARFPFYDCVLSEYDRCKDLNLLYRLQKNIEEALLSFGDFKSKDDRYSYCESGIRGGYTRTLDSAGRFSEWAAMLSYFVNSPYCTSDFLTAFLKALWDTQNYLLTNTNRNSGNWTEFIFRGILMTAGIFKEFKREFHGENWLEACHDTYERTVNKNFFQDGSYKEGNSGYCQSALVNYISVKRKLEEYGIEVSDHYKQLIQKNAYYCANLFTADGSSLRYGDCANYRREECNDWRDVCDLTGDEMLRYLVTYGEEGIKPKSTMFHSQDSCLTVMRSDFKRDAVYLFSDVRGGGGHSHCDENSIILSAYGRTLLCDSGVFSYTADDPYRIWGLSTRAHNTVEIDEKNQVKWNFVTEVPKGKIHEIYDDNHISKVCQSSYAYKECEHKRSITFVKPDLFIIEDELIAVDKKEHTYDVLWHFPPKANAIVEGNQCRTRFEKGANIKIITIGSCDNQIMKGCVDLSYSQAEEADYLRTRLRDSTSIKTVLVPEKENCSRNIEVCLADEHVIIKEDEKLVYEGK